MTPKRSKKLSSAAAFCIAGAMLSGCAVVVEPEDETAADTATAAENTAPLQIRAQDDFYGYVNYDALSAMEIDYEYGGAGSFFDQSIEVNEQINDIIREMGTSGESYPEGSPEELIRSVYQQYMAYDGGEESSEQVFSEVTERIYSAADLESFVSVMAWLKREYGIDFLIECKIENNDFIPGEYQVMVNGTTSICGTPYKAITKSTSAGFQLRSLIESILKAQGADKDTMKQRASDSVSLTASAARKTNFKAFETAIPLEYINTLSTEEMCGIFTSFDFESYIRNCGAEELPDQWYSLDTGLLEEINSLLTEENLPALKDLAMAVFCDTYGMFLPDSMADLRDKYYLVAPDKVEKTAFKNISNYFAEQIGDIYSRRYMDEETIQAASKMCEDMRESYRKLINGANWLSPETRKLLEKKLDNLVFLIGAPEPKGSTSENKAFIGSDLLQTYINIKKLIVQKQFESINQPFDKLTFRMAPQTVNACYTPDNIITIPMGIIGGVFFDKNRSEAANLGGLGDVIAHEMSHAFDSDGIGFNADGYYDPEWLPEADRLAFEEKMRKAEEYYSGFTIMDVYHVDGKLTLGENFADLGAFECILLALGDNSSDSEKKELMETFASTESSLSVDKDAISSLREDEHSPSIVRINAVVSSCDEFYRLYGVSEGDGMYIAPEDRISRW